MGMFDRVLGRCPHCGELVELQSKAGQCLLDDFWVDNVPIEIAADLADDISDYNTTCEHCSRRFRLVPNKEVPRSIKCTLEKWDEGEDGGEEDE